MTAVLARNSKASSWKQAAILLGGLGVALGGALLPPAAMVAVAVLVAGAAAVCLVPAARLVTAAVPAATLFLLLQPVLRDVVPGANLGDDLIAIAIMGAVFAGSCLSGRVRLAIPGAGAIAGVWLALALSAAVNLVPPVIAALGIMATAKGMTAYWLGYNLNVEAKHAQWYLSFLLGVGVVAVAVAFLQMGAPELAREFLGQGPQVTVSGGKRALGIFSHPKELAQFVTMLLCFGFGAAVVRRGDLFRAAPLILVGSMGLLLARSKSAIAIVMVLLVIVAILRFRQLIWPLLAGACIAGLAAPFVPVPDSLAFRMQGIANGLRSMATGEFDGNFAFRLYNIYKTHEVFGDAPIVGLGPGRWGGFIAKSYRSPAYDEYEMMPAVIDVLAGLDVDWLRTLGEGGILATIAMLLLLIHLVRRSFFAYRHLPDPKQRMFACGVFLFNIFILIEMLTSQLLESPFLSFYFWGFNGLLAGWLAAGRETLKMGETTNSHQKEFPWPISKAKPFSSPAPVGASAKLSP